MMNSLETGEIYAQLGNFMPLDQMVEWTKQFADMMCCLEDADVEPNFTDIIVPMFVYSVKKDMPEKEAEEIKIFLNNCRDLTGIFPIVVLTHKTGGPFSRFRDLFEGMGAEQIIAVENYTADDHLKTRGRHFQFLKLIYEVLQDVTFKLKEIQDPKKERAKRKKFLLRFYHEMK